MTTFPGKSKQPLPVVLLLTCEDSCGPETALVWGSLESVYKKIKKREKMLLTGIVRFLDNISTSQNSDKTLHNTIFERICSESRLINWLSPEGQPICCRSTVCPGFIGWADTMAGSRAWPSNSNTESWEGRTSVNVLQGLGSDVGAVQ